MKSISFLYYPLCDDTLIPTNVFTETGISKYWFVSKLRNYQPFPQLLKPTISKQDKVLHFIGTTGKTFTGYHNVNIVYNYISLKSFVNLLSEIFISHYIYIACFTFGEPHFPFSFPLLGWNDMCPNITLFRFFNIHQHIEKNK